MNIETILYDFQKTLDKSADDLPTSELYLECKEYCIRLLTLCSLRHSHLDELEQGIKENLGKWLKTDLKEIKSFDKIRDDLDIIVYRVGE